MRTVGLFLLLSMALALPKAHAQDTNTNLKQVGTIAEIMRWMIYPTSNDIFNVQRAVPKDDFEWEKLERSALTMAEAGNLLMIGSRVKDQGDWIKDSKMLVDVGVVALKLAKAKDADALAALNEDLNTACTTCHQAYRPRRQAPR
jgi:cytochrome c556